MANDITEAGQMFDKIEVSEEIRALLLPRGYGPEDLAEGRALQTSANETYGARQTAISRQRSASDAVGVLEPKVRETFADFRETVTKVIAKPDWAGLGATGRVPGDTQKFITAVRNAYLAGKQPAYAAPLAKYGYPATTLDADLALLKAYESADSAHETAMGAATQATKDRNADSKALDQWLKQFKPLARLALKSKPGLVKELKL